MFHKNYSFGFLFENPNLLIDVIRATSNNNNEANEKEKREIPFLSIFKPLNDQ